MNKETVYIDLTKDQKAIVDKADLHLISDYKWTACFKCGKCYALSSINGKTTYMHQLILNYYSGIDHVDGNGLNNTRVNIRKCNHQQNAFNTKSRANSSSKYKGVSWLKRYSKWRSQISINGRAIVLGTFLNEEDAAKAYDNKAKELFGEFAYLNFK